MMNRVSLQAERHPRRRGRVWQAQRPRPDAPDRKKVEDFVMYVNERVVRDAY